MLIPKHVYALFANKDDAIAAYNEIQAVSSPGEHCSVLLHEGRLDEGDLGPCKSASHESATRGALIGGAGGAVITGLVAASGGLLGVGFLTGLALGGGLMALYGAVFGGIAGSDDAERQLRGLDQALKDGEILIAAKIDEPELVARCREILDAHGGRSIGAVVAA